MREPNRTALTLEQVRADLVLDAMRAAQPPIASVEQVISGERLPYFRGAWGPEAVAQVVDQLVADGSVRDDAHGRLIVRPDRTTA